jgi:superoxide dismutase, Cu-Zn family
MRRAHHVRGLRAALCAALLLGGCAAAEKQAPSPITGGTTLKDKDGKEVGRATLIETPAGVRIAVTGYRLPPGPKALVLSAVGACEPPQFVSAGTRRSVGGDLPAMTVSAAGEAGIDQVIRDITLSPGGASLFRDRGAALLVLANPDAPRTDPTGEGGTRIACGVLVRD